MPISRGREEKQIRTTLDICSPMSSANTSGSSSPAKKTVSWADQSSSSEFTVSAGTSTTMSSSPKSILKPFHRRSGSSPSVLSGSSIGVGSGAIVPSKKLVLPVGNIVPSGVIKTGMARKEESGNRVLRSLSDPGSYGYGSVVRRGVETGSRLDLVEVMKVGNEHYRNGRFAEGAEMFGFAIELSPGNVELRNNRAAALAVVGMIDDAIKNCEEVLRIKPTCAGAHRRLVSLLGQTENAKKHMFSQTELPEPMDLRKLETIQRHLEGYQSARKVGDWRLAMRECDAAIAAGVDSSSLLTALRAECLLRLYRLDKADSVLIDAFKLEASASSCSRTRVLGMLGNSYLYFVQSQVEIAQGRFESAELAAVKAGELDPYNKEIASNLLNVRSVISARVHGNELFNAGRYEDACIVYSEALKNDLLSPVLYCNRAACHFKLEWWQRSIDDCSEALRLQANYSKALLRRARSYAKLEKWCDSIQDYEILRGKYPHENSIAEALFHARVAFRMSRGEDVTNMTFRCEVEKIVNVEQLLTVKSLPELSVVHFISANNEHCERISSSVNLLRSRYPYLNFLQVDVNKSTELSAMESIVAVPTVKFYKNGSKIEEIICPSRELLEYTVEQYNI